MNRDELSDDVRRLVNFTISAFNGSVWLAITYTITRSELFSFAVFVLAYCVSYLSLSSFQELSNGDELNES